MDPHEKSIAIIWGPLISYHAALHVWTGTCAILQVRKASSYPSKAIYKYCQYCVWRSPWDDGEKTMINIVGGKNLQWSFEYTRRMLRSRNQSSQHISLCIFPPNLELFIPTWVMDKRASILSGRIQLLWNKVLNVLVTLWAAVSLGLCLL